MERKHRKKIGVLTSGGDAQGMNAAVRAGNLFISFLRMLSSTQRTLKVVLTVAVVRMTLQMGGTPYGIMNGYQGMVDNDMKVWSPYGMQFIKCTAEIRMARCWRN